MLWLYVDVVDVDVVEAVRVVEATVASMRNLVVKVTVREVKQRQEKKMVVARVVEKDEVIEEEGEVVVEEVTVREVKQRQEKKMVVAGVVEKDEVIVEEGVVGAQAGVAETFQMFGRHVYPSLRTTWRSTMRPTE